MVHQSSHRVLSAVIQSAMFSLVAVLAFNIPSGVTSFYVINGRTSTGIVEPFPSHSSPTRRSLIEHVSERRGFRSGSWDRFSHGFGKRNQAWNPTVVSGPLKVMDAFGERLTDAAINSEYVQHDNASSSQMKAKQDSILSTVSRGERDKDVSSAAAAAAGDAAIFRLFSRR